MDMTPLSLLTYARIQAELEGVTVEDYLAVLCCTLASQVSPGYMRAGPETGPSEKEIQRREAARATMTAEEMKREGGQ